MIRLGLNVGSLLNGLEGEKEENFSKLEEKFMLLLCHKIQEEDVSVEELAEMLDNLHELSGSLEERQKKERIIIGRLERLKACRRRKIWF